MFSAHSHIAPSRYHKKNKKGNINNINRNNMQETRRQSKRIAESGTGGVLETVKVLLPKIRRAPAAAKKPASAVKIFH